MDWQTIRHVPVEDPDGRLVGLVFHRSLVRLVARGVGREDFEAPAVAEIMRPDPVTVSPDTPTVDAIRIMREQRVGCLPVVEDGRLVGLLNERDLIDVAARLLEEFLGGV